MEYSQIVSPENLFLNWYEYRNDKRKRIDLQIFEQNLEKNIFELSSALQNGTYIHQDYSKFTIYDPKHRVIHKAEVQDRLVHHVVLKALVPIFDKKFIFHSYSGRINKGTHAGFMAAQNQIRNTSKKYTSNCWGLKMDIRKFYSTVDQNLLLTKIFRFIHDKKMRALLEKIIFSFTPPHAISHGKGMPIGNVTSQLFANIYLDELDKYIKHIIGFKSYFRYSDDMLFVSSSRGSLTKLIPIISEFVSKNLLIDIHPNKTQIRHLNQGIDFLGFVILPHHARIRSGTKLRIFKKLNSKNSISNQTISSYNGLLKWASEQSVIKQVNNYILFEKTHLNQDLI